MNEIPEGLTIQAVSERCGVNPVTLRAWERRYGLVRPYRSSRGHRRYSEAHVDQVKSIVRWLDKGVPIREVRALLDNTAAEPQGNMDSTAEWAQARQDAMQALDRLNSRRLEQLIQGLLADYGHAAVITHFCVPLREQLSLSASLEMQLSLFDSLLAQKWSSRALSLAPRKEQFGWILVPLGKPLATLELAMTLGRPVWCLASPVAWDAVRNRVAQRQNGGVIWVADSLPSAAQRRQWLPCAPAPFPTLVWGPLASRLEGGLQRLADDRSAHAEQLNALERHHTAREWL